MVKYDGEYEYLREVCRARYNIISPVCENCDCRFKCWTEMPFADHIRIQQAIDSLPANGGKVVLLDRNYNFGTAVTIAINNVTIEGVGAGTTVICSEE